MSNAGAREQKTETLTPWGASGWRSEFFFHFVHRTWEAHAGWGVDGLRRVQIPRRPSRVAATQNARHQGACHHSSSYEHERILAWDLVELEGPGPSFGATWAPRSDAEVLQEGDLFPEPR